MTKLGPVFTDLFNHAVYWPGLMNDEEHTKQVAALQKAIRERNKNFYGEIVNE